MKRCINICSVVVILLVLCAQAVSAYEFVGKKFRVRNTNGSPAYFYDVACWSPDKEYVFCWGYDDKYDRTNNGMIYKVPANGGEAVKILDAVEGFGLEWPTKNNINCLSCNPDGNSLTFQVDIYDTTRGSYSEETRNGIRYRNPIPIVVNVDFNTLKTTVLVDAGSNPVWSPDGRYLLYQYFDNNYYLDPVKAENMYAPILYDTETGEHEFIEFPEAPDGYYNTYTVTFGPYNTFLYFVKKIYMEYDPDEPRPDKVLPGTPYFGEYQIVRKPLRGGEIEIMTERLQGDASGLSISPDGRWLLFNDKADVLILDTSCGKVYNALTGKPHTEARYFPDSIHISGFDGKTRYELDGEPVDPLTDMFFQYRKPTLLSDGTQFIYSVNLGANIYNSIYLVDFNPSLYTESDSDGSPSGENNQPEAFATLSNFPNPFNPVTTIGFTLSEGGNAKLEIYDITGRKVRELAEGFFIAGSHTVGWDARDDAGNPVSSGVFISRLTTKYGTVHDRMTLVK